MRILLGPFFACQQVHENAGTKGLRVRASAYHSDLLPCRCGTPPAFASYAYSWTYAPFNKIEGFS